MTCPDKLPTQFASTMPKFYKPRSIPSFVKELAKPTRFATGHWDLPTQ